MKTKFRTFGLPMGVALLAVGGAFASTVSSQSKSVLADRQGHIKVGSTCTPTQVTCSNVFNLQMCSDGSNILYDWNGTSCPLPLYKKVNP